MLNYLQLLLAEADPVVNGDGGAGAAADQNGPPGFLQIGTLWIPMLLLFYFFFIRPSMNQQRKAQEQMSQLKKNDRVVTRSGIYGTIFSIDRDKNIATIKIDESTNTKIEVTLASIENVIVEQSEEKSKA